MELENKELLIKDLKDIYEKLSKALDKDGDFQTIVHDVEFEVAEAMDMLLDIIGVLEKKG